MFIRSLRHSLVIAVGKLIFLVVIATANLSHSLANSIRNLRHLLAVAVVNPVIL